MAGLQEALQRQHQEVAKKAALIQGLVSTGLPGILDQGVRRFREQSGQDITAGIVPYEGSNGSLVVSLHWDETDKTKASILYGDENGVRGLRFSGANVYHVRPVPEDEAQRTLVLTQAVDQLLANPRVSKEDTLDFTPE